MTYFYTSYWKRLPRQGWLYLSVSHMCFYSYILSRETKLIVRWADIIELDKTNSILFPDSIRVMTRDNKEVRVSVLNNYRKRTDLIKLSPRNKSDKLIYIFDVSASFLNVHAQIRNIFVDGAVNEYRYETVIPLFPKSNLRLTDQKFIVFLPVLLTKRVDSTRIESSSIN